MSDPMSREMRDALNRPPYRRDWDGVAAIIAALVGLLALCVSGYTAFLQKQQVRAQVWPYLEPGMSASKREVVLFNKGVGPAIIHNVQIRVDNKPQHNWSEVFNALGLKFAHHIPYSTVNGVVISGNDKIEQLAFPTPDDFNLYSHQVQRVNVRICYCSSLGDCWQFDDAIVNPGEQHPLVDRCPARTDDDFRDNEDAEPALPVPEQEK